MAPNDVDHKTPWQLASHSHFINKTCAKYNT